MRIFSIKTAIADSRYTRYVLIVAICCLMDSCKDYLQIDPPVTSVNAGNIYKENATATAALTAVYSSIVNTFGTSLSFFPELSADNLTLYSTNAAYKQFYQNALNSTTPNNLWVQIYPLIYSCNAAIEGLNSSNTLTPAVKERLLGEAYFIRAFCYFYLVNLYGDVPLITSTSFKTSIQTPRTSTDIVYQQIVSDLNQASNFLDYNYVKADAKTPYSFDEEERVRPNRAAAIAMLARVQLYLKNYTAAEAAATELISRSTQYSSTIALDQVFLKNSKETIWALQPVITNVNTGLGSLYILPASGPTANSTINPVYASSKLIDSFEPGDQRKEKWINNVTTTAATYNYPAKYKIKGGPVPVTEYTVVLRLAEQYLIRAEARIQLNDIPNGISDLNILRYRANDSSAPLQLAQLTSTLSKKAALVAVTHERQVELFTEWGDRWFDLKRTGQIDSVMTIETPLKGGNSWSSYKALYPIPFSDINATNILIQNPGYN